MRKIIGIAGKARSGKDTIANYLWHQYGFTRTAFADPIKLAAAHMFGLSREQTWDDSLKEQVIPYWGMSPRRMFQLLGTEASKPVFGDDIWVKRLQLTLSGLRGDDFVIPDVRHELEAEMIRKEGGIILHLYRDNAQAVAAHSSEVGIAVHPDDYQMENNGTLQDLYRRVDHLISEYLS